jgi:hypothetical protein
MSKKLSYKGMLAPGNQEKIRLRTNNGKTGYKITKFDIISNLPGSQNNESIVKLTKIEDPNIVADIDFTDSKLMAVAYNKGNLSSNESATTETIIFDNEITNQDMFVNVSDAGGGSVACNYYIELEAMNISDIQATEITLRNIRQVLSVGST